MSECSAITRLRNKFNCSLGLHSLQNKSRLANTTNMTNTINMTNTTNITTIPNKLYNTYMKEAQYS